MIEQRRVPMAEADLALATSHKFLELLAARDFERLVASLASDAHARFLLPHGLEEYDGRDAIVARIRSWFGSASVFDLAASTEDQVGMRHRISWRFNVVRDGSRQVIEQVVYLDLPARRRSSTPATWAAPTAWLRSSGARSPRSRSASRWRSSSAIPRPKRICPPWHGCSGSGSRPPRRTTTGASPSLWRDRNEREADLQLHLGP